MNRHETTVFGLAALGLILSVAIALAGLRPVSPVPSPMRIGTGVKPLKPPFVMFQTLAPARAHGRVAMVDPHAIGTRHLTALRCSRMAYAGGRGVCVTEEDHDGRTMHVAVMFDRAFQRGALFELAGVPTRVRIAPTGDVAAITTYGEEESAAGERLAIETVLIDVRTGTAIGDLRDFTIDAPGDALTGPFDFASVAFDRDGDRFFATLTAPAARHIVVGSVRDRRLRPIAPGLANEALSPDGTRLIVKRRIAERGFWELGVLDLASLVARPVDQGGRSVDDQVEWLDDRNLLYHDASDSGTSVWTVAADGQSPPRPFLPHAISAAVVR